MKPWCDEGKGDVPGEFIDEGQSFLGELMTLDRQRQIGCTVQDSDTRTGQLRLFYRPSESRPPPVISVRIPNP